MLPNLCFLPSQQLQASTPVVLYRYLRVRFSDSVNATFLQVAEIAFYNSVNTRYPTQAMTDDNVPSPLVASASSWDSSLFPAKPYRCFDRSASNLWSDSWGTNTSIANADINSWVQIDLGSQVFNASGGRVEITGTDITLRSPKTVQVVASNTGAFSGEEVVILPQSANLTWTDRETKTFNF